MLCPMSVPPVAGSQSPRKYRKYDLAGQVRYVVTWVGRATPPAPLLQQLRSSHTSIPGMLNEQAERHCAQVFATKANRQTMRGSVLLRCQHSIDARHQCGAQSNLCGSGTGGHASQFAADVTIPVVVRFEPCPAISIDRQSGDIGVRVALGVGEAALCGCTIQSTKYRLPSRRSARQMLKGSFCRIPSSSSLSRTIGGTYITRPSVSEYMT